MALTQKDLAKEVNSAYFDLIFAVNKRKFYKKDSLYTNYEEAARARYDAGETNYLEKISAEAKRKK